MGEFRTGLGNCYKGVLVQLLSLSQLPVINYLFSLGFTSTEDFQQEKLPEILFAQSSGFSIMFVKLIKVHFFSGKEIIFILCTFIPAFSY